MSITNEAIRHTHESGREPVIEEEEAILRRVDETIRKTPRPRQREDYAAELIKLRDSLGEARLAEDRASIIEQMSHLSHLSQQLNRTIQAQVDRGTPYFGHMKLEDDDGEVRDILIGRSTFIREGVNIVDWRHAPISRVFYQHRQGDDYVMNIDGHETEGEVRVRRTVLIEQGELQRVQSPEGLYVRGPRDWERVEGVGPAMRGGAGTAIRPEEGGAPEAKRSRLRPSRARVDKHLPEIAALLDAEQYALITQPDSGLIAIQGSAGSGKTTVALHRVAYLAYQDARRFAPSQTLIIVYSRALASYISKVLPALGVEGVKVQTFSAWTRTLRKRLYPRLPDRINTETPAAVVRMKQHAAMLNMLTDAVPDYRGRSVLTAWGELFTSLRWLSQGLARYAPGEFDDDALQTIHQWCVQMHMTREEGGGANSDDLPTLDAEDDAILLRMHQLLKGKLPNRRKRPLDYGHLVIDEAQDLAPLEIAVLLDTVRPGNPITLAGDTAQKLMEGNDFQDWAYVLNSLGLPHVQLSPLKISYRSTAPIMEVAHAVLGPLAPPEPPEVPRDGPPVELFRYQSPGEAYAFLAEQLHRLMDEEPHASVALLARYGARATDAWEALVRADVPRLTRVHDQDFSFAPGIEVTEIHQVKGLEFDYVVVLDAESSTYPPTDSSRHLLHVAITRAAHMCWLMSVGTPSPILPKSLSRLA